MRKNPQYFEGVLQLRNPTQKIIDFVADEIEKNEDVWIARAEEQRNGVDLYISSNKFLIKIGKKLRQKFTGELKKSKTLFTKNKLTSKEVYRGCILFRYIGIRKGDTIKVKGNSIKVISVGKDIYGKNTKTNTKIHIQFKSLPKKL